MKLPQRSFDGLRRSAFVFLAAAIVGVGSERMFWFWAPAPLDHLVVALMYSVPVGVVLWLVERHRVTGLWSLLLVTPLAGLVTEGVLTPVVYAGGPFVPVFPAWFAFWHGVFSVGILLFGIRWMLIGRRWALLAGTAVSVGVFWGVWSSTLWLPENVHDAELEAVHGPLEILTPERFAIYAVTFTAILALTHWLIGFVWPTHFGPARITVRLWSVGLLAAIVGWTVAIPWALPMFGAYWWLQKWGLRRHERIATDDGLLSALGGPVPVRGLLALAPMPAAAGAAYQLIWWSGPSDVVLRTLMYSIIGIQAVVGAATALIALRRAGHPTAIRAERDDTPGERVAEGVDAAIADGGGCGI